MAEIIAALLGGLLAAGTGWLIERQRRKAQIGQLRRVLTRAMCDDLSHCLQIYDKITEEWNKTKTVWFVTLNELRESRQPNNKD
jgi:hypothetical protein